LIDAFAARARFTHLLFIVHDGLPLLIPRYRLK